MNELILDACCGTRGFWFDKKRKNVIFADKRSISTTSGKGKNLRKRVIEPDIQHDFRKMPYRNKTFHMVVFDPPHLFLGENSYMAIMYGRLDKKTWENDIKLGFSECFRVLKNNGLLIFKWNESDVPLKNILRLTEYKPLFGHLSGKKQKTHWVSFLKS